MNCTTEIDSCSTDRGSNPAKAELAGHSACCNDCSICPRRDHCPSGSSGHGSLPSHGSACPISQTLGDDRGGLLTLERTKQRPLLSLEWNNEQTKVTRERLESITFDPAGRVHSFSTHGSIWRRGLDGRVLEISHTPSPLDMPACHFHEGRVVEPSEAKRWEQWLVDFVIQAQKHFGDHPALQKAASFDLAADAVRFLACFRPVGILPPDQYRAIVFQLTRGCSYNKCTFCSFFKKDQYALKSPQEFASHVDQALDYFSSSLGGRRGVFLGEANAVNVPFDNLLQALETVQKSLAQRCQALGIDAQHFTSVYSFMDTFSVERSVEQWRQLRLAGLDRLYLGIESGSDKVLKLLRKPGTSQHTAQLIATLKQAGLKVGPIIMTGVGGQEMAEEHIQASADLLNSLPLGPEDRIYISEFMSVPDSEYASIAKDRNLHHLNRMECRQQSRQLRALLEFATPPQGPAAALYDVRQFIY